MRRIVMFRKGIHRDRYHTDGRCSALLMHEHKHDSWEAVTEETAQTTERLKPCRRCVKDPVWYVTPEEGWEPATA